MMRTTGVPRYHLDSFFTTKGEKTLSVTGYRQSML